MHVPSLPPALLDLISLRASVRSNSFNLVTATKSRSLLRAALSSRQMHQAALASAVPQYSADAGEVGLTMHSRRRVRRRRDGALSVRTSERPPASVTELQRKVEELQNIVVNEDSILNLPGFSEEELSDIYQDLLALPSTDEDARQSHDKKLSQAEEDQTAILAMDQRLLDAAPDMGSSSSPVASSLRQRRIQRLIRAHNADQIPSTNTTSHDTMLYHSQPYRRIISRLQTIIARLDTVRRTVSSDGASRENVPIGILSNNEWPSLVRTCLQEQDADAAEQVVVLMKRCGVSISEESINDILAFYADQGDIAKTESFMSKVITESPTNCQRDLHIKSHLRASPTNTIPHSALSVLHQYELQCIPAPIQSYTRLITALFSAQSSIGHAQAWDLYTHMRYVAHPTPDALLYTLMIRACASSLTSSSEPERALDLWTEMTVDHKIQPSAGTYTAIILACARSGSKMYIHEAFRLAKEMLDSHRDASGRSAFRPDSKTFSALLEGAKRVGDLARARWILAEMVRETDGATDSGYVDAEITEEVMMHIFHAYAAYTVPFKRATAPLVDQKEPTPLDPPIESKSNPEISSVVAESSPDDKIQDNLPMHATMASFSHLPPQSRSEVIGEVRSLFSRILHDRREDQSHYSFPGTRPFRNVNLTPRLLNSYLSVHYMHAPFEDACNLFKNMFEEHGVNRNIRSYVEALERCGRARRGRERTAALAFADELWVQWQGLEHGECDMHTSPKRARMIERANVAMIRIWTLVGNLDQAVGQVKAFANRYPPSSIRQPVPKLPMQSTRAVLQGQRPLVRMTSTVEIPDDTVPPLLTFADLESLHHRLVAARRNDDIGYIKYICKTYEWSLRTRRNLTMRAEPA